jgi:Flp pilus assembly protein TadD
MSSQSSKPISSRARPAPKHRGCGGCLSLSQLSNLPTFKPSNRIDCRLPLAAILLICLCSCVFPAAAQVASAQPQAPNGPQTNAPPPKPSVYGSQTGQTDPASAPPATSRQLDPQLTQAKELLAQGKIADADGLLRTYLTAHPDSADAHFLRGYLLFRQVQASAITRDASQRQLYKEQGAASPGTGAEEASAKDSLNEFTQGAKYRVPSAFDLKIVALDYTVLGDYSDADKWLTHSLQANPQDADAWYLMGRTKYSENRFDEAAQSFQQYLKFDPKNIKAEDNLGLSYAALGQNDKAIAAYQNAIAWQAESPVKDPGPFLDLGVLLMDQNRTQEAVTYFLQAVAIAPKESRHHEELGQAYFRLDDLPKAQQELETAVGLSPQNARLHYLLGRVYNKEGLADKAKAEFDRSESLKVSQTPPTLAPH